MAAGCPNMEEATNWKTKRCHQNSELQWDSASFIVQARLYFEDSPEIKRKRGEQNTKGGIKFSFKYRAQLDFVK